MANITPRLPFPGGQVIRYYQKDYAGTDTESEGEAPFETDTEDEEQYSISARLQQNQQYMDRQISPESGGSSWILESQPRTTSEGTNVVLIRKPTASNLSHRLLNPYIYRNIGNVGSLDALARLLQSPSDWEAQYNEVVEDGEIAWMLNAFYELPTDTSEADVQFSFAGLVASIAVYLRVLLFSRS